MTRTVTVIGLERHANLRQANGIECDVCHRQINFDRADAKAELATLAAEGWIIPPSSADLNSPTYCPDHRP